MSLKAHAFSSEESIEYTSDIERLEYVNGDVTVVIASSLDGNGNVLGIEAVFPDTTGFRLLDEVDLARYWTLKDFPFGRHILEVEHGGWSMEENALQGYDTKRREWLVVTGNACVSVFAGAEPTIKSVTWKFQP